MTQKFYDRKNEAIADDLIEIDSKLFIGWE